MGVREFNPAFFRDLGKSAGTRAQVVAAAEAIAADARANAPVDSGEYRDRIHVVVDETEYRVVARVVADAPHSLLVESRHGTLAQATQRNARG